MTTEFLGKVGLVTGGTSGIGREAAVLFAKAGAKVVVAGRREAEGKETIDLVRAAGGDGLFVKADISKAGEVLELVQKTVQKFGRLDVAFNNAGIEGIWVPITDQSEEDWDRTIDINLKGVWLCLKYEIRQMLKQGGGGAIVNMSSIAGLMGSAGAATYRREQARCDRVDEIRRARERAKRHSSECSVSRGDRNTYG
jgi:NAD(P)-dependent dehydrogenase (short-subunit alcohol dehydrogenase family)